ASAAARGSICADPAIMCLGEGRPSCYDPRSLRRLFRGSSAVEQPAVNRLVAGSNPARGANKCLARLAVQASIFCVQLRPNASGTPLVRDLKSTDFVAQGFE